MVGSFYDYKSLYRHCWKQCYDHLRWMRCDDSDCCAEFPCDNCREYVERRVKKLVDWYKDKQPVATCPSCGVRQYFLYGFGCETVGCVNYHTRITDSVFCPF